MIMEEKKETKTRIVKGKQGYGYKYTELAQINEYLESNNMSYYQYVDRIDSDDYIMTVPIIDGKEQQARRGVKIVDATLKGIQNPAQEQGSATTYARRYSLLMAFGLATEDDDAQSLSRKKEEPTKDYMKENLLLNQKLKKLLEEGKLDADLLKSKYGSSKDMTNEQLKEVISSVEVKGE